MKGLKESGQAVGAQAITRLADAAAPTVLDQAARLQSRQRFFNLTVTNVPGPQVPLYVMGRRLEAFYPKVPLVLNTALGIAIMSYDGHVFFGLLGDYDALRGHRRAGGRPGRGDRRAGGDRGRAGQARTRAAARRFAREARPDRRRGGRASAAAGCVALISVLASRDSSQVDGTTGPGVLEPDRGSARSAPARRRPPRRRPSRRRAARTATRAVTRDRPSSPTTRSWRRCSSATS